MDYDAAPDPEDQERVINGLAHNRDVIADAMKVLVNDLAANLSNQKAEVYDWEMCKKVINLIGGLNDYAAEIEKARRNHDLPF